jgi:cullin 1
MLGLDETDPSRKTLDIYKRFFEVIFIDATKKYYGSESEKFLAANTVVAYMRRAEQRLSEESSRVDMYLDESTMKTVRTLD